MEVIYRRSLHKSYMCIKESEIKPQAFEMKMLENRKIPKLLSVQTIVTNGEQDYLYEISGKQQLEDFISGKKINYEILRKFLVSLQELCSVLSEYFLRENGICLELEFIYVNLENGNFYFTYVPFWEKDLSKAFEHCMEQILGKIDHRDKAATELGYQVYQMSTKKNANLRNILEDVLRITEYKQIDKKQEEIDFTKENVSNEDELSKNKKIKNDAIKNHDIYTEKKRKKLSVQEKDNMYAEEKGQSALIEDSRYSKERQRKKKRGLLALIKNDIYAGRKSEKKRRGFSFLTKNDIYREEKGQEKIWREAHNKILGWLQDKDYVPLQFLRKAFEKEIWKEQRSIDFSKESRQNNFLNIEKKQKEKKEEGFEKKYQKKREENKEAEKKEENIEESIHPTEILRVNSQQIIGKLIYQGIHGCADILIEEDEFLLGKNRQQVQGVIEAEGVSRLHARISRQENIYYIEDLNSTNGTYLNEIPLEYHQKRELCKNDHIRFGIEEYVFS